VSENMTSKEIVNRAITFSKPERVPYELPEPYGSDIVYASLDYPKVDLGDGTHRDIWGAIWKTLDAGMGQIIKPPIANWSDYDSYQWPDLLAAERWQVVKQQVKDAREKSRFIVAGLIVRLYEQLHFFRGLDNIMMDYYDRRKELEKMADDCVNLICKLLDKHAEVGADGMMFCDDRGLQDGLMINPELWREFYKPRYAKIYAHAHELGLKTFLHSCGYIVDILDDFIEIGLDVIQMDQQVNMGIDLLSKRFGGRITFFCPVDIQAVMPKSTPEEVAEYAGNMMYKLGRFDGGFIGKWYPSPEAVNHPKENIDAMAKVFANEGKYPLKNPHSNQENQK